MDALADSSPKAKPGKKTGPGGTEFIEYPKALRRKERVAPEAASAPVPQNSPWGLRQSFENAKRAVAEKNGANVVLRENLEWARSRREEFWMDTCRDAHAKQFASGHVMELYRKHGCRFCVPTLRQVQHILDALDSALPHWDRDHPELFYQTMELNFPELVRACRTRARV